MTATDATRLAGEAYRTRFSRSEAEVADDKTRLAQEGYRSKLARDAGSAKLDESEFYKVGEKIGDRYEVSAIHYGELGVVYGCFDHQTKLPRALKTVRARQVSDKQVLALFESEAAVWISLERHPYIVRAYLVERFKNLPYVITEYVRGPEGMEGDLRGWLGHPRLTLPVAVAMALQIAQGMQHAVRKVPNLVHRDLKPGNILVNGDGKAMITDFGLVYAAQSGAGTPAYMSPEQWREEALDARSDIYAYGCILFEMFTGHRLFAALTEEDWQRAHLEIVPAELVGIVPDLPGEIDQFVRRCLAKEISMRPRNWDEIVGFFAEWCHRLTGKAVILDFSSIVFDSVEWVNASYSFGNLNRYKEALLACDRALEIDSNNADAWINKGVSLTRLMRNEEAIQAYDRALAIDKNYANGWRLKGLAFIALRHHEEAVQAYDRALAIDHNYASAWRLKGHALSILERAEEAIQAYSRAIDIDPGDWTVWFGIGQALSNLERYEDAILHLDSGLAIEPNCDAWRLKGLALSNLGRYQEAIHACERALTIDESDAASWYLKGEALSNISRDEDAIHAFDKALTLDKQIGENLVATWYAKGGALSNLNRYEEAIDAYDQALAIDENQIGTWYTKGLANINLNRHEEAIQAFDRALAIDSNHTGLWNGKGHALINLKRYREAIKSFDRALTIDAGDTYALHGRKRADEALKAAR